MLLNIKIGPEVYIVRDFVAGVRLHVADLWSWILLVTDLRTWILCVRF